MAKNTIIINYQTKTYHDDIETKAEKKTHEQQKQWKTPAILMTPSSKPHTCKHYL